jgi:hypothetical protein
VVLKVDPAPTGSAAEANPAEPSQKTNPKKAATPHRIAVPPAAVLIRFPSFGDPRRR